MTKHLQSWEECYGIQFPHLGVDDDITAARTALDLAIINLQVSKQTGLESSQTSGTSPAVEAVSDQEERSEEIQVEAADKADGDDGALEEVNDVFARHRPDGAEEVDDDHSDVQIGVEHFKSWTRAATFAYMSYNEDEMSYLSPPDDPDMPSFSLRDTQVTGVSELVSRAYRPHAYPAAIIADETSIGKTIQAGTFIAEIAHRSTTHHHLTPPDECDPDMDEKQRQKLRSDYNKSFPLYMRLTPDEINKKFGSHPTIHDTQIDLLYEDESYRPRPFAKTKSPVPPALPSIIIAPAVMTTVWQSELSRCFPDLSIHLIKTKRDRTKAVKSIKNAEAEWSKNHDSEVTPAKHVVIISYNQVGSLYKQAKRSGRKRGKGRAKASDAESDSENVDDVRDVDLFGMRYNVAVNDEAHFLKSPESGFTMAAAAMNRRANFVVLQTATPITKSPLDIAVLAGVAGLPEGEGVLPGDDRLAIPQYLAAKEVVAIQEKADKTVAYSSSRQWFKSLDQVGLVGKTYPAKGVFSDTLAARLGDELASTKQTVTAYDQTIGTYLSCFVKYMIRRTRGTKDKAGQAAVPLGHLSEYIIPAMLTVRETEVVKEYLRKENKKRKRKVAE